MSAKARAEIEAASEVTSETNESPVMVGEQFNAHDAKRYREQVDKLKLALAEMNLRVSEDALKSVADAQAACEILVAHGICTEAEVQARAYRAAASLLAAALQQAEEARLAQTGQTPAPQARPGRVQVVRKPPIAIARR